MKYTAVAVYGTVGTPIHDNWKIVGPIDWSGNTVLALLRRLRRKSMAADLEVPMPYL